MDMAPPDAAPTPDAIREIRGAIHAQARILDRQEFTDWLDLYTDDGVYSVITFENEVEQGPYILYDSGKTALKHRAAWLIDLFHVDRAKTLHQITNIDIVAFDENEARTSSYFAMYRTVDNGLPRLEACGEYRDVLIRQDGAWKFRERKAIIDNGLLPAGFTDLV